MSGPTYEIYCDKADDEELAAVVFRSGPLKDARIRRLPARKAEAPEGLREFLSWERSDWLILRDGVLVAAAELSRHGYTGDNGFQRFARLQRSASLGVPGVYFTPFSRTRLNENDLGQNNPRNVAPEMFKALLQAGKEFDIPCLAIRWPTDEDGEPHPLGDPAAKRAINDLRDVMVGFATRTASVKQADLSWIPDRISIEMQTQAHLPFRGSEVRFVHDLPIADIEDSAWLDALLPDGYFGRGKADKILAKIALDSARRRPLPAGADASTGFWSSNGRAQVLYLGYQWRPDPSCGLIAFSGTLARAAKLPLIVAWPRVFLKNGRQRRSMLAALEQFHVDGTGKIASTGRKLGFTSASLEAFQHRINTHENQFGVFTPRSKVGRILADNAELCVFGDALYLPR